MEKNQEAPNLMDLNNEQLEQLAHGDKADSIDRTSNAFSDISAEVDIDDDPFTKSETEPMEIPKNFTPRVRRVSDVIDSIGDIVQDLMDTPKPGSTPDKVPPSPLSSGYGSFGNGNVHASAQWYVNLPSPTMKTRSDVTDGTKKNSDVDAYPMDQDSRTSTGEQAEGFIPVDKEAEEYNMNHKRRGKAVIFNHDKFEHTNMGPRDGSHIDVQRLDTTLSMLGFEVIIHHNLDYTDMKSVINEYKFMQMYSLNVCFSLHNIVAQEDHSDADCLLITVLTHGMGGNYLLSKDVPYNAELLWSPFTADKCVSLAGKPKIFIIQVYHIDMFSPLPISGLMAVLALKINRGIIQ
ncbi:hypothetical protein C0J52_12652 [Blattella germanica]|nr:hypothetical protein C0J52_12652 [Blattella germanica]